MHTPGRVVCGLVAVLFLATPLLLPAQRGAVPNRDWPLAVANVLPSGQPVVPIFESWIPNPDGTIQFSFGYINLNSEEVLHIPLGPDNFIEPRKFDGFQPTHFEVAPKERARFARHQSVFIVTAPQGFKGDVVWTLRVRGQTYSSPARATRGKSHGSASRPDTRLCGLRAVGPRTAGLRCRSRHGGGGKARAVEYPD
jgi:hypothetical protein